jgi:hypothetical protein
MAFSTAESAAARGGASADASLNPNWNHIDYDVKSGQARAPFAILQLVAGN